MADLRVEDIPDIIKYTIIELRRLYKTMPYMGYHLKCSFIEILIQYMFALYARVKANPNKETIKVVSKNIISSYNKDGSNPDLAKFINDLCLLRNNVAHARQIPKTINWVNRLWTDDLFKELLHVLYVDVDETPKEVTPAFNPALTMIGE